MPRNLFVALTLTSLVAMPASAQVKLTRKLPEGKTITERTTVDVVQALSIAGMDVNTSAHEELVVKSAIGNKKDDGSIPVVHSVDSLKSNMTMPFGVELQFDSTKESDPPGTQFDFLLDLQKAVANRKWTFLYKDGEVVKVEGSAEFLKSLDDTTADLVRSQFEPEYLRSAANQDLNRIPTKTISPGDTWSRSEFVKLEAGQSMTIKSTFTYVGPLERDGKTLDKITFESTDVSFAIDPNNPSGLSLVSSELKLSDSGGTILFDRDLGMSISSVAQVNMKGKLTMAVQGQELPANLELTIKTNVRAARE